MFLISLVSSLEGRVKSLSYIFDNLEVPAHQDNEESPQSFPLSHGLLLAARCVSEASQQGFLPSATDTHKASTRECNYHQSAVCIAGWHYCIKRLLSLTHEAFRTALKVVAEASTDVQFAPSNAGGAASSASLPSGRQCGLITLVLKVL